MRRFHSPRLALIRRLLASAALAASWLAPTAVRAATAEYQVTFDATWSQATHPTDFPGGSAHFSPLIGVTHDDSVLFWELAGDATEGMEVMAETGGTSPLQDEIDVAILVGSAASKLLGSGIGSPGSTSLNFELASDHPLVTLVTMIAPSPDWFVGVSSLALYDEGAFVEQVVVDLVPYDAGTDSGISFTSANANTDPQDPISLIDGFPFTAAPPLGTFTFTRVPEPAPELLALCALVTLGALTRRRGSTGSGASL